MSRNRNWHTAQFSLIGWASREGAALQEDEMLRFMVNVQTGIQSLVRKVEGQDVLE